MKKVKKNYRLHHFAPCAIKYLIIDLHGFARSNADSKEKRINCIYIYSMLN